MSEFFSNNDSREDRKSITIDESLKPIDRIKPESQHHGMVLSKLNKMLKTSEDKMNAFYERWGVAEKKMQAYIDLSDAEEIMKEDNDAGKAPKIISIVVPYSYSTISTIVTYLIHTFTGQKPMFSVSPYKAECIDAARNMETILQYQADHSRLIKQFYQWFMDGEIYGVGIMKTLWEEDEQYRTKWKDQVIESPMQGLIGSEQYNITERVRVREKAVVYQGNKLETIDPYRFFPDPSVPMEEVNKKGQFVFWRDFVSKQSLKDKENKGIYKYVAHAGNQ
ncbi:MAG: hypothetical protein U9O94_08240, partial [Nanoarchaeota archaeon]|nr:hypothetical protein [Nanoarchaeota archaeon]